MTLQRVAAQVQRVGAAERATEPMPASTHSGAPSSSGARGERCPRARPAGCRSPAAVLAHPALALLGLADPVLAQRDLHWPRSASPTVGGWLSCGPPGPILACSELRAWGLGIDLRTAGSGGSAESVLVLAPEAGALTDPGGHHAACAGSPSCVRPRERALGGLAVHGLTSAAASAKLPAVIAPATGSRTRRPAGPSRVRPTARVIALTPSVAGGGSLAETTGGGLR